MIAVLMRASRLVEVLAAVGSAGISLREAAKRGGLPPATATRLLHALCELGWADQEGQRGCYRLGPRLEALAGRRPYRGRLVAVAGPVLTRLVDGLRGQGVLAVLRRGRRLSLLEHGERRGAGRLRERANLYDNASGRMLVAQLGWRARQHLVTTIGLPTAAQWAEATTWPDLNAACAQARRQGWILNQPEGPYIAVGVPVPDDEGGVAAIAVSLEKERWSGQVVMRTCRAAATITRRFMEMGQPPTSAVTGHPGPAVPRH